jgi:hypothetical protein
MRECKFIRTDECVWVPSPGSWLGGWARHMWLERHFGKGNVHLAGAEHWADLTHQHPVKILTEENNIYTEKDS